METQSTKLRKRSKSIMKQVLKKDKESQLAFFGLSDDNSLSCELARIDHGHYDNFYSGEYFDIILTAENRVIGSAGFHTYWRDHDRAEIGYSINIESDKRQGYMNEIMPVLLKYGFETIKLHRVEAHTAMENKASIRLLKKYGFKKEATIHQRYKMPDGSYSDDYLFYLINKDY